MLVASCSILTKEYFEKHRLWFYYILIVNIIAIFCQLFATFGAVYFIIKYLAMLIAFEHGPEKFIHILKAGPDKVGANQEISEL